MRTGSSFYIGVDLGQSQDYTAIAIIEHLERTADSDDHDHREHEWHLRHCERLPLGTSYQDVTKHISGIIRKLQSEGGRVTLIVDSTGVGRPVIDSLKEDGLKPIAVTVTGGLRVVVVDGEYHVPKRDLVSSAKMMLAKRRLKIAKGMPFADILVHELEMFRVKINIATARDTYEAWREGDKDDLVFALCLTCWWALQKRNFVSIDEVITDTSEGAVRPEEDYRIGWAPARNDEEGALAVYNVDHGSVVSFQRLKNLSAQDQIDLVFLAARRYDAAVWAEAGDDEAILKTLEYRGAYVSRVDAAELAQAYENLTLLISYKQIQLPNDPGLLADVEAGNNNSIMALCLVTHDIHPEIEATQLDFDEDEVHSVLPPRYRDEEDYYDDDDDTFGYF